MQNFLRHYEYFDYGPAAEIGDEPNPGHLDRRTMRALIEFQLRYDVGTPGVLDGPTRALMAAPRCGVSDLLGGSTNFATTSAWTRRNLSYQFGRPGASMLTSDLAQGISINAIRRALNTWAGAGVGLTFRVITGGDIASTPTSGSSGAWPLTRTTRWSARSWHIRTTRRGPRS